MKHNVLSCVLGSHIFDFAAVTSCDNKNLQKKNKYDNLLHSPRQSWQESHRASPKHSGVAIHRICDVIKLQFVVECSKQIAAASASLISLDSSQHSCSVNAVKEQHIASQQQYPCSDCSGLWQIISESCNFLIARCAMRSGSDASCK